MPSPGLHPDRSLGWLRRTLPVVATYRTVFAASMTGGLISVAATRGSAGGNRAGGWTQPQPVTR